MATVAWPACAALANYMAIGAANVLPSPPRPAWHAPLMARVPQVTNLAKKLLFIIIAAIRQLSKLVM